MQKYQAILLPKLKYIILVLLAMPLGILADGVVTETINLNGQEISAEYTIKDGAAWLGSGRNACIPQYAEGEVTVPDIITVDGHDYHVVGGSDAAFRFCTKISTVDLANQYIERIGNFVFNGCLSLTTVKLPSTLTSIGSGAFIDLPNLSELIVNAETPPVWEYNDVFCFHNGGIGDTETYKNTTTILYVPEESIGDYKTSGFSDSSVGWTTSDGWKYFQNVLPVGVKTLILYDENDSNSDVLREHLNSQDISVQLMNRTLHMTDGSWNTLCLPFALAPSVMTNIMDDYEIKTLSSASFDDGTLTINFSDATTAIEAGQPFLIRWDTNYADDLVNPTFSNVDITTDTPSGVEFFLDEDQTMLLRFQGIFDRFDITHETRNMLYLGTDNTLYYPQPAEDQTISINAFHAYFELEGLEVGNPDSANGVRSFVLNFDKDELTVVSDAARHASSSEWYTINGLKLSGRPTMKGVYINNGTKRVIR